MLTDTLIHCMTQKSFSVAFIKLVTHNGFHTVPDLKKFELAHTYTLILQVDLKFDFDKEQVIFNFQVQKNKSPNTAGINLGKKKLKFTSATMSVLLQQKLIFKSQCSEFYLFVYLKQDFNIQYVINKKISHAFLWLNSDRCIS